MVVVSMTDTPYEAIKITLPSDLASYVRRAAAREERTISGLIRRLVSEAARLEPPPPTPGALKVMENVESTPEAIAAAKARLVTMRQRQEVIAKRSRGPLHEPTPAVDDLEYRELGVQIDFTERQILMAERFLR
jgi:hypothetical protein